MFRITSTLPLLLVSLLGGVLAILAVFWSARQDVRAFETQQAASMARSAADASGYIEEFVSRRIGLVEAFAQDHVEDLKYLSENPDDDLIERAVASLVGRYFPKHFAFTTRRMDGEFVPDDLGEFVGEACRSDMDRFAEVAILTPETPGQSVTEAPRYMPVIHPQPFNYHFDVTAAWRAADGTYGLLMISFKPDQLVEMLRAHELPYHELMLFREDTPELIEVTSAGWRETVQRDGRLSDAEFATLQSATPVPGTRWRVAYLPSQKLFSEQAAHTYGDAAFNAAIIFTFMLLLSGWYLISERARRRDAEEKVALLRQSNRAQSVLERVIDVVPLPIFRRNSQGKTDLVNAAYAKQLEMAKEDVHGKTLEDLFEGETAALIKSHDAELLRNPDSPQVYERLVDLKDGSGKRTIVFHKITLQLEGDTAPSILGAAVDVTEERKLRAELEHLATTDPLTGVANRRKFTEVAESELARSARYGNATSLVLLDIDHFKSVNDTYGHDFGDAALKQTALILSHEVRVGVDLVARIGGEEFALVLPETDDIAAVTVAERIRTEIEAAPVTFQDRTTPLTISLGVATCFGNEDGVTLNNLIKQADTALYKAKANGRNQTVNGAKSPTTPNALVR